MLYANGKGAIDLPDAWQPNRGFDETMAILEKEAPGRILKYDDVPDPWAEFEYNTKSAIKAKLEEDSGVSLLRTISGNDLDYLRMVDRGNSKSTFNAKLNFKIQRKML